MAAMQGQLAAATVARQSHQSRRDQRDAFAQVVDERSAAAEELARLEAGELAANPIARELGALQQATSAMLARSHQRAETHAQRLAEGPAPGAPPVLRRRVRIAHDGDENAKGPDDLLSLGNSPVAHPQGEPLRVHAIERAMDAVNASYGQKPRLVADLLQAMAAYLAATSELAKASELRALFGELTQVVAGLDLEPLIADVGALTAALAALEAAASPAHPVIMPALAELRQAAERTGRTAARACALYSRVRLAVAHKIAASYREVQVCGTLRRTIVKDRLLRRILLAEAAPAAHTALGAGDDRPTAAWLVTRLEQKVRRMSRSPAGEATLDAAHLGGWAADIVASLREQARQLPTCDALSIRALTLRSARGIDGQLEQDRCQIAEQERRLEGRLAGACAHLATAELPLPDDLAEMDLQQVVAFVHRCWVAREAADGHPQRPSGCAVRPARPPNPLTDLHRHLSRALTARRAEPRLQLHLERQLERVRARVDLEAPVALARTVAAFHAVYGGEGLGCRDELLPLAGEVAASLSMCPAAHLTALCLRLGAASCASEEADVVSILQRLVTGGPPEGLEAGWTPQAGEVAAGSDIEAPLRSASLALVHALQVERIAKLLAERAPPSAEADTLAHVEAPASSQEALAYWLPQVDRWLAFAHFIPEAAVAQLLRAAVPWPRQSVEQVQSRLSRAVLPADVSPACNPDRDEDVVAMAQTCLSSREGAALGHRARSALFLLATRELSREHVSEVHRLVRDRLPADTEVAEVGAPAASAGPTGEREAAQVADSPGASAAAPAPSGPGPADDGVAILAAAEQAFAGRLWDGLCDLGQRWGRAAALVRQKLALVRQHDRLSAQVPVAKIERLVAMIDSYHPSLQADAQVDLLAAAAAAATVGATELAAALQPIKADLWARLGRPRASRWLGRRARPVIQRGAGRRRRAGLALGQRGFGRAVCQACRRVADTNARGGQPPTPGDGDGVGGLGARPIHRAAGRAVPPSPPSARGAAWRAGPAHGPAEPVACGPPCPPRGFGEGARPYSRRAAAGTKGAVGGCRDVGHQRRGNLRGRTPGEGSAFYRAFGPALRPLAHRWRRRTSVSDLRAGACPRPVHPRAAAGCRPGVRRDRGASSPPDLAGDSARPRRRSQGLSRQGARPGRLTRRQDPGQARRRRGGRRDRGAALVGDIAFSGGDGGTASARACAQGSRRWPLVTSSRRTRTTPTTSWSAACTPSLPTTWHRARPSPPRRRPRRGRDRTTRGEPTPWPAPATG